MQDSGPQLVDNTPEGGDAARGSASAVAPRAAINNSDKVQLLPRVARAGGRAAINHSDTVQLLPQVARAWGSLQDSSKLRARAAARLFGLGRSLLRRRHVAAASGSSQRSASVQQIEHLPPRLGRNSARCRLRGLLLSGSDPLGQLVVDRHELTVELASPAPRSSVPIGTSITILASAGIILLNGGGVGNNPRCLAFDANSSDSRGAGGDGVRRDRGINGVVCVCIPLRFWTQQAKGALSLIAASTVRRGVNQATQKGIDC